MNPEEKNGKKHHQLFPDWFSLSFSRAKDIIDDVILFYSSNLETLVKELADEGRPLKLRVDQAIIKMKQKQELGGIGAMMAMEGEEG